MGLGRLSSLEPKEPVRRYERECPGEVLHFDIKKLARLEGVGHRITGNRRGASESLGYDFLHVAIDEATRLGYVEALLDERRWSTTGFLIRALRWFRERGVCVKRVMSEASALDEGERIRVKEIIEGTWDALRQVDSHFGFRVARAVVRFVNEAKASSGGVLGVDGALDAQLCQKVLTKLRGEGDQWAQPLGALGDIFAKLGPESRSAATVDRMRRDLERLGSFQFWN